MLYLCQLLVFVTNRVWDHMNTRKTRGEASSSVYFIYYNRWYPLVCQCNHNQRWRTRKKIFNISKAIIFVLWFSWYKNKRKCICYLGSRVLWGKLSPLVSQSMCTFKSCRFRKTGCQILLHFYVIFRYWWSYLNIVDILTAGH